MAVHAITPRRQPGNMRPPACVPHWSGLASLVPLLLQQGLKESWYGLGALSALLTIISWRAWPRHAAPPIPVTVTAATGRGNTSRTLRALILEYGLNAFALVPHMVFLVDFVAR